MRRFSTWAGQLGYIAKLRAGQSVSFRPRGHSMRGKIESGQLRAVVPVDPSTLEVGDIVLCNVHGNEYLQLVKVIQEGRYQIGNDRGLINGWVVPGSIYGKCVHVED
jgi:hypothetical protein